MSTTPTPPPGWNGVTFQNGRRYAVDIRLTPPSGRPDLRPPWISVEITRGGGAAFKWITGRLDTGASRTMLTFADAAVLGILKPSRSALDVVTLRAANKTKLKCYVHRVTLRVNAGRGNQVQFPLDVGIAKTLARSLFGFDWTWHFCLAIDATSVHLLRD